MIGELMAAPILLEPGEELIVCVRQHWIAFYPRFLLLLVAATLPAGFALGLLVRLRLVSALPWRVALVAAGLWIGFWLLRAILLKRRHERTVYAVTNRRVLAIRAAGPFSLAVSSRPLDQVREVRTHVSGPLATLLHFGEVLYGPDGQGADGRANESRQVAMTCVPHPDELALRLQSASRAARGASR